MTATCLLAATDDPPLKIIFDTDLGSDVDDVGALAVLNKLADSGECEIIACVSNAVLADQGSAAAIDAINTYYGRPSIPIGTYQGTVYGWRAPSTYTAQLRDEFPHTALADDRQPTSLEVYRKALASAPDNSVKIVSVGFLINLEDLLRSKGDAQSPLSGPDLVRQKVRELVVMGGQYPSSGPTREWNFSGNHSGPHTAYVLENWPTPILFTGMEVGEMIQTGAALQSAPASDPVRRAYELFNGLKGRESWDLTAVLAAVRNPELYWTVNKNGYCRVDPETGANSWTATPQRGHSYLVAKVPPSEMAALLDGILLAAPGTPLPTTK